MKINTEKKSTFRNAGMKLKRDVKRHPWVYIMMIPVVVYYIIFAYVPMIGNIIAFENYSPRLGMFGSEFVGLTHFRSFLADSYFWRAFRNTLVISVTNLIFSFPAPIILALLLNEVRNKLFKKSVQTLSYLPYFVSLVVLCGMIKNFLSVDGIINDFVELLTGNRISFLQEPRYFTGIYVISGIWQGIGWGSILYIAALAGINPEYYEAAVIDGAGRFKQLIYITLPCLKGTMTIMFILAVGNILSMGHEKIILLYNPIIYEKADVIASYIYRKGLQESNVSYSTAVGLVNSICNLILIFGANTASRKLSETSLW